MIIARLVGQVGDANRGDVRGESLSVVNGDVIRAVVPERSYPGREGVRKLFWYSGTTPPESRKTDEIRPPNPHTQMLVVFFGILRLLEKSMI